MIFRKKGEEETGKPESQGADRHGGPCGRETTGPSPRGHELVGAAPVHRAVETVRDPLADDLIRRVLRAIDEWMVHNDVNGLPPHIAFQQALSMLNAIDRSAFPRDQA
jgi:hypothetical protein